MSGWAPFDVDGWEEHVELFLAPSDKPWPRGTAIYDLRWHVDQRKPLPGRGPLATRWKWDPYEVRKLLKDTAAWWDPTKGVAPACRADLEATTPVVRKVRPERAQSSPSVRPDIAQSTTDEPAQSAAVRPDIAQSSPSVRPEFATRVESSPSPTPSPSPNNSPPAAGPLDRAASGGTRPDLESLATLWNTTIVPLARGNGGSPPTVRKLEAGKGIGKDVRARVDQHGLPAVEAVFRWFAESKHERAGFLRRSGNGLKTLVWNSNFEEYLGYVDAEAEAGLPAQPSAPRPELSAAVRGDLDRQARTLLETLDLDTVLERVRTNTKLPPDRIAYLHRRLPELAAERTPRAP
jgi:hypothetical protein